ncbi:MAG: DNA-binding transcriptional regulator OxyR [Gammaproteobacteria bacterium]|nr:DNA-binding transcriptional regulator OxyR [Gammaproteobacteria bacterium]
MNLRELEYLVAISEERHFHKAAQRCFVSQPTLSGQLKKLENELGILLVERNNRQVIMTDVGEAVADQARNILAQAKGIKEIAQSFYDPMAGELHVGLIPTVAPYLLPIVMPALRRHYPKLRLWLHEYQTMALLEKLRRAELDVLILALPVQTGTNEFAELHLFNEPFQLAVARNEALADKSVISLNDLDNREILLLEEGHCLRDHALEVCLTAGALENAAFHASSLETLRHMVAEGMGITLMPELAVPRKQTKNDTIRYLSFKEPKPIRRLGMLYRKGSYRKEAFTKIQTLIQDSVSGLDIR